MSPGFVIFEEEHLRLETVLQQLKRDSSARAIYLIDRSGQQIASAGEVDDFDSTSLASLASGNVAATDGLAKLIGEREFSVLFHEGAQDHIHISIVAERAILLVIFDEKSSLGLVRLRVRRAAIEMERVFDAISRKGEEQRREEAPAPASSLFGEITDDDIDALFGD